MVNVNFFTCVDVCLNISYINAIHKAEATDKTTPKNICASLWKNKRRKGLETEEDTGINQCPSHIRMYTVYGETKLLPSAKLFFSVH
jgi:hypothetical protein